MNAVTEMCTKYVKCRGKESTFTLAQVESLRELTEEFI